MKTDRTLQAILVIIVLLVIVSLAVFFIRKSQEQYLDENSPEGVVHNYILALHRGDLDKAFGYLLPLRYDSNADEERRLTLEDLDLSGVSAVVGKSTIYGKNARVNIEVRHYSSDLFGSTWADRGSVSLKENSAGEWKIEKIPYPYSEWDWEINNRYVPKD